GALWEVAESWLREPFDVLVGRGLVRRSADGALVHDWAPRPFRKIRDFLTAHAVVMAQPSTFLSTQMLRDIGALREDLHYILDWELYLRMSARLGATCRIATTVAPLSCAVHHPDAKTWQA